MTSSTNPALAAVLEATTRRAGAVIARDIEALNKLHADGFVYVHSSAKEEPREDYINTIVNGGNKIYTFEQTNIKPNHYNDIVHITSHLKIKSDRFDSIYVASEIWVQEENEWKLRHHQNTKIS
jgi:hypothetical protein